MLSILALVLKAFVLVGLGATAAWTLRRASAALRHRLWVAVLASVALVAVTSPLAPRWSLPSAAALRPPSFDGIVAEVLPRATIAHAEGSAAAALAPSRAAWARAATLVWLCGTGALLLRLVAGHVRLRGIARRARTMDSGPVPLVTTSELETPATWGVLLPII